MKLISIILLSFCVSIFSFSILIENENSIYVNPHTLAFISTFLCTVAYLKVGNNGSLISSFLIKGDEVKASSICFLVHPRFSFIRFSGRIFITTSKIVFLPDKRLEFYSSPLLVNYNKIKSVSVVKKWDSYIKKLNVIM